MNGPKVGGEEADSHDGGERHQLVVNPDDALADIGAGGHGSERVIDVTPDRGVLSPSAQ